MTNTIDELTGHALNVAVAQALGWVQGEGRKNGIWWASDGIHHRRIPLEGEPSSGASYMYDPAHNIATALDELDGEEWTWIFEELPGRVLSIVDHPSRRSVAFAKFADHPTKPEAYATAHCRAFLKAQAAQSNEEATP